MACRHDDPQRIPGWAKFPFFSLLLVLASAATSATGLEYTGRLNSSSYIYETFSDAQGEQEIEVDQLLRLGFDFKQLGHPALSLSTLQTIRNNPPAGGDENLQLKSYRLVLHYRPERPYSVSFGRQWVNAGVGTGLVDGLSLRWWNQDYGRLTLFGGTRGFLDPLWDSVEGFDTAAFNASGSWGLHYLSPALPRNTRLALSASRRFRGGVEEDRRLGALLGWDAREDIHLSYDLRYELGRETAYYQRVALGHKLDRGNARLSWTRREAMPPNSNPSDWILSYFSDRLWFPASFEHSAQELRAAVTRPCMLLKGWNVNLQVLEIFPSDDDQDRSDGLSVGWSKTNYAFGYRLQRGFGGDRDGLYGSYRRDLGKVGSVWLELNQVYFRYGDAATEELNVDDSALASRIGYDSRLAERFDVRAAIELLNNPRAKTETRLLVRVGYRFSGATGE